MSENNVIPFRKPTSDRPPPVGKPELVLDPGTGLYSIVVDGVEVYAGLDPIGKREFIRRNPRMDPR